MTAAFLILLVGICEASIVLLQHSRPTSSGPALGGWSATCWYLFLFLVIFTTKARRVDRSIWLPWAQRNLRIGGRLHVCLRLLLTRVRRPSSHILRAIVLVVAVCPH